MNISATSPAFGKAVETAADRTTDAALAKASAKLAADKRSQASADTLRADQKAVAAATKAAQQADAASSAGGKVSVTA